MYWRRRLLALAVLIAVAWVVVKVVGAFDDAEPTTTSPTATPSSQSSATSAAPTTTAPPADQVTVALQTAATECDAENLRIVPSVPGGQRSGGPVDVDLLITTLDSTPCTFQPSNDDLLVVVDTSRAPIYDSSVCRAAFFDEAVAVPADWGTVARVQWTGRGSGTGCGSGEGYAPPGRYTLKIGTYGGEPGEVTFALAQAQAKAKPSTSVATKPSAKPTATPQSVSPAQ